MPLLCPYHFLFRRLPGQLLCGLLFVSLLSVTSLHLTTAASSQFSLQMQLLASSSRLQRPAGETRCTRRSSLSPGFLVVLFFLLSLLSSSLLLVFQLLPWFCLCSSRVSLLVRKGYVPLHLHNPRRLDVPLNHRQLASMGNFLSALLPARTCKRLNRLWKNSYWLTSTVAWVTATAAITLAAPVIFHYEKECQLFETQAQFYQQQAAAAQALAGAGGVVGGPPPSSSSPGSSV